MSKGHGRIERAILELLKLNKTMTAPALAAFVYRSDDEIQGGDLYATEAERAAVRRALGSLQKQDLVVKLGNLFQGERCSYAGRETAVAIISDGVKAFGKGFLSDRPDFARLYTDSLFDTRQVPSPSPS
jgi:hypothetical protein